MKRALFATVLTALAIGPAGAVAGMDGNCSPEGTWYGYNDQGNVWIVTITRSGPQGFTTVMDYGPNDVLLPPEVIAYSDWRGEFVKTGPDRYDWTTMALWRGDGSPGSLPFAMGYCPLAAEFTSCDSWEGMGTCSIYGFFSYEADPFEDGFWLFDGEPLHAFFKRMPMSYPVP